MTLALSFYSAPALAQVRGRTPLRRAPLGPRVAMEVNGVYQIDAHAFTDSAAIRENAENGRFDVVYDGKGGPGFDVAAALRIARRFYVGAGITQFSTSGSAALTAAVPHPFFFDQPREITANIGSLQRQERAVHIQLRAIFPVGRRLVITVFGGPSVVHLRRDLVTDFTYTDAYPYDTPAFGAAATTRESGFAAGFNGGGDLAFYLNRPGTLGVGLSARVAGATIDLPPAAGAARSQAQAQAKADGVQAAAGLRLRF
ncbi:MAG: hypothetical protein ABI652_08075 [Acidobacteriota bacterium]